MGVERRAPDHFESALDLAARHVQFGGNVGKGRFGSAAPLGGDPARVPGQAAQLTTRLKRVDIRELAMGRDNGALQVRVLGVHDAVEMAGQLPAHEARFELKRRS